MIPYIRWEVIAFARKMEAILRTHDHEKGEAVYCVNPNYSLKRLGQELQELRRAYKKGTKHGTPYVTSEDIEAIQREAVDVANFAMMVYLGIDPKLPIPTAARERMNL